MCPLFTTFLPLHLPPSFFVCAYVPLRQCVVHPPPCLTLNLRNWIHEKYKRIKKQKQTRRYYLARCVCVCVCILFWLGVFVFHQRVCLGKFLIVSFFFINIKSTKKKERLYFSFRLWVPVFLRGEALLSRWFSLKESLVLLASWKEQFFRLSVGVFI